MVVSKLILVWEEEASRTIIGFRGNDVVASGRLSSEDEALKSAMEGNDI